MPFSCILTMIRVTGTLIGFSVYIVWSVILFAGHIIDMEIGLSMATIFDPQTKTQITISGQFYQTIFMLIFINIFVIICSGFMPRVLLHIDVNGGSLCAESL